MRTAEPHLQRALLLLIVLAVAACSKSASPPQMAVPPAEAPVMVAPPPAPPPTQATPPAAPPPQPAQAPALAPSPAAAPLPGPAGAAPAYAKLPPKSPLKYREVSMLSLAISYTKTGADLSTYLQARTALNTPAGPAPIAQTGVVENAPAGKYAYLMARIESCLLLDCGTQDNGVRQVGAEDPMDWYWPLTPAQNEGGGTIIAVGIYGGPSADGPWTRVATMPEVLVGIGLQQRYWFEDNWDKILGMAGAALSFLVGLWLKRGKGADA